MSVDLDLETLIELAEAGVQKLMDLRDGLHAAARGTPADEQRIADLIGRLGPMIHAAAFAVLNAQFAHENVGARLGLLKERYAGTAHHAWHLAQSIPPAAARPTP